MELSSLGKDPIQADQPTGSDVRYEPEYEQLQAEIDKLSLPSASAGIDWKKVSDLAASILAHKSKDLLVASYLAVGQVHMRQIEGLADGLVVIHDLIATYWDGLFPPKKRMRGRVGALEWWIEKTESALAGVTTDPIAPEKLESINTTLAHIDTLMKQHLPEPLLLRPIQRSLETIPLLSEAKPEPEAAPAGERPQPSPPTKPETLTEREAPKVTSSPIEPETPVTEKDAQKVINSGLQKLRQAAAVLLEKDPTNAVAYRCRRVAAWSLVSALPPESNGHTQIPPPQPQIHQELKDLKDNAHWSGLIASAEQRVSQFLFWFDLHRYVSEALVNLGNDYQSAHEAVCQETAYLLYRLPGLVDLTFSDGTPFADSETRRWLKRIVSVSATASTDTAQIPEPGRGERKEDAMADTVEKARALAKKNKLLDAVQLLQAELKNCLSQKEALMWRLALCRMLIGSKRTDMALPHLDLILKDIESYRLENWDPRLALEGLKVVWSGYNNHTDKALKRNAEAVLSQIAKLDPAEALKLSKS
ncbi:MAG: type VI secretion system protein TssA [Proteobacteria bacterium]|nr:type VI secretion system protein TssA [Pseudomonadota bacterium]